MCGVLFVAKYVADVRFVLVNDAGLLSCFQLVTVLTAVRMRVARAETAKPLIRGPS